MINFDSEPRLYLVICNLLLAVSALISFYPLLKNPVEKLRFYNYLLLYVLIITFVAFRLPVVVYNVALNPDESMFIVGAMTLAENPVYWESVDGATSGPFSFYTITAFCELFRQPYDYISARIVGLCLMISSLILNYFTLRKFFSTTVASICIFCVVAFLGPNRNHDFIHFGSEHLPIFLLSVMCALYSLTVKNSRIRKWHLFFLGIVAGMVPFAKLQAAPIAAIIIFITYWLVYQRKKQQSFTYFVALTLGGFTIPAILFTSGAYLGFLDKLWLYYIKNNLSYGSNINIIDGFIRSINDPINIFTKIILILSITLVAYQIFYKKQFRPNPVSLFIIGFTGSSIFAVFKPGFMFHHYLLLLVFPTTLLFGYFLDEFLSLTNIQLRKVSIAITLLIVLSFTVVVNGKNEFVTATHSGRPMAVSSISEAILKYSLPHEPLVIWGESGKYYLETKRIQGIRWSHTYWGMYNETHQSLFRKEYVKEFRNILAPVFIDTHVNEGSFIVRKLCGYETVPELKKLIEEKYQFLAEINQHRIYIRNDRITDIQNRKEVTELKPIEVVE